MPQIHRTTCNRDCPDACSILVQVEDGRATALRGDPEDPVTQGFLCRRTSRFLHRQYHPERFTHPMLRRDGRLVPIGWEEALELAARRLVQIRSESGPSAILHYRSGGSLGMLKLAADSLFERFGPVTTKRGSICSGAGEAAQLADFGICDSNDFHDILNSRAILLWGKNPHTSNVHLLPVLKAARKRGARILAIDPMRTRAAQLCDQFIVPRPGTDHAIALGMARWLFENDAVDDEVDQYCNNLDAFRRLAFENTLADWAAAAQVSPRELETLAASYGRSHPAAILIGWGLGRRINGSATVRAIDALAAISGNLGVSGGGASFGFSRRGAFETSFATGRAAPPRTLAEARLGQEILAAQDPPIRAVWVTAANPVSMLPDSGALRRALERVDFTVVVDTHPSDTTDAADLVLPTLTLLEDDDLLGAYGNHYLRISRPALAPPGEARHELWILQELARRIDALRDNGDDGDDGEPLAAALAGDPTSWKRRLLARLADRGVTPEALAVGAVRNPLAPAVLFADRHFPTADGKVQLLAERPAAPTPRDPEYPLLLHAAAVPGLQSSQRSSPLPAGPVEVRVHPAAAPEFSDGERALLQSRLGELEVRLNFNLDQHPELAFLEKGGMLRDGRCANLLIHARETDAGGSACYYEEPVRLVRPR